MIELDTIYGPVYVRPQDVVEIKPLPRTGGKTEYDEEGGKTSVSIQRGNQSSWHVCKQDARELFEVVNTHLPTIEIRNGGFMRIVP